MLAAIPWLIAILGWGFTHMLSEARERRKEVRGQLDKVIDQLMVLEKSARSFHLGSAFDPVKAMELRLGIDILKRKIHRIGCVNVDDLASQIVAFRRSVTLKNFEPSEFSTQDPASKILTDISSSAFGLEDALESQYLLHYPRTFPYFRRVGKRGTTPDSPSSIDL